MNNSVFIEDEEIELRTIEKEDIEWMKDNINDQEIRKYTTMRYPTNYEQEENWFEKSVSGEGGRIHLLITENEKRKGIISFVNINKDSGNAEVGLWISSDEQGKGYGTKAAKLMTEYGFRELRLHRIYARVFEFNPGSKRIWEKLGYKEEGMMREHGYLDGEYRDMLIYGVLMEEWKNMNR